MYFTVYVDVILNSTGNAEFLEKLIAAAEDADGDANVNAKDSKWLTPLHRACRQGGAGCTTWHWWACC